MSENKYDIWKDVDYTYDDLIQTDEYRELIDIGLEDTTSNAQKSHLTLRFIDPLKAKEYYQTYAAGRIRKIWPSGGPFGGHTQYMRVIKSWGNPQYRGGKSISFETYKEMLAEIKIFHLKVERNAEKKLKRYREKHGHDFVKFIFEAPKAMAFIQKKLGSNPAIYKIITVLEKLVPGVR